MKPETPDPLNGDRLLTPGEVAGICRVDPRTVTRWAKSGKISAIRIPGGHRRYRESDIRAMLLQSEEISLMEGGDDGSRP